MKAPKPIVTDTYDFPTLIRNGNVYIDKTAYLHRLVSKVDGTLFFISRPRRFGKSLMISTLEQIFKGNRALFKGLDISKSDYDWKKHPIIRLDMTAFDHTSGLALFKRSLAAELGGKEPVSAFRALIAKKARASHGKGVVVLVDEYDAPVSGLLGKPKELEAMREFLQTFYRILKQEAGSIRFLMMTGVSKFTKLSVFFGLNNLTDLSMRPEYAALLGYTKEELEQSFRRQIAAFAKEKGCSSQEIVSNLLQWYDSYRFSPKSESRVCNPVSIGRALIEKSFSNYWEGTGNSSLILERLRSVGKLPDELNGLRATKAELDVCDVARLPVKSLMYQSGYLTIKEVLSEDQYVLGVPNKEILDSLSHGYVSMMFRDEEEDFLPKAYDVREMLRKGETDGLIPLLTSVFAMVPHEWKLKSEAEAKRYFLLFMKMAGADITPELESSKGRADAVVETEKAVYIFEFKYGKTARAALKQINEKGYVKPYAADKRRVIAIGVNYDPRKAGMGAVSEVVNSIDEVVNPVDDAVNDAVNSLYEYIKGHPGLNGRKLAVALSCSEPTIDRQVKVLKVKGLVEFRGAPKNGGYYVR